MPQPLLCSECFTDQGLKLDAATVGIDDESPCPNCGAVGARKLDARRVATLAHRFFVRGTVQKLEYGFAPMLQFNEYRSGDDDVRFSDGLDADAQLISRAIKIGIFRYGPRLWMVGEVEPLRALQSTSARQGIVEQILVEYPSRAMSPLETFYRIRIDPQHPADPHEYDSPPAALARGGRLNCANFAVMYGSQDLEVCVHECRAMVDDALFLATIAPTRSLRLLDLSAHIEESGTEFESLDLAVHMLFLAGCHSYEICTAIALAARDAGFDGLIYPSYFSLFRTGATPLETVYGISIRRLPSQREYAQSQVIPNIALFGRPVESGLARVACINRLMLNRVAYDISFGPATFR
jgi:hypothetical protein